MATRTISAIGGNWNSVATWAEAAVPTSSDNVVATSLSGQLTVNVNTAVCASIDLTGYTNTMTFTAAQKLTVSGNITFPSGMVLSGTGSLVVNATSTLTNNISGNVFPGALQFGSASTFTLGSNWKVTGTTTISGGTCIINGNTLTVNGNLTVSNNSSGTTSFVIGGTGTWNGSAILGNSLNINTAGTLTLTNGTISYGTGTLTYTTGTIVKTGNLLQISATCTLDTSGMTWNNITANAGSPTVTLSSNLNCGGTFTSTTATIMNGNTLNITGGFSVTNSMSGTTNIVLNGTGTWSTDTNARVVSNNLTINTAGTITLGTNLTYQTGTLTYTAGTIVNTSSTFTVRGSCTLDTSGMTWNNITLSIVSTVTLNSNLNCGGTFNPTAAITMNGNTLNASGNLTITNVILSGTTNIVLNGTGTWSGTTNSSSVANNLTINTSGTITIGTNAYYKTGTLTYTAGTVTVTSSTLNITGSCTLDTSGMTWLNVANITASTNVTLNSNLNVSGTFTASSATTFNGSTLNTANLTASATLAGTTNIVLKNTGTWSGNNAISNNLTINNSGTTTISGTVQYKTGTLTYTSSTIVNTSSTLLLTGSCTLDTSGMTWNNISESGAATITLNSNLNIGGNFATGGSTTINSNTVNIGGNFTHNNNISGTSAIVLNGTGTWSGTGTMSSNININTGGTITLGTTIAYGPGTLVYTAGTIINTGSTLNIKAAGVNFNTSTMHWGSISFIGATGPTLLSNLICDGTIIIRSTGTPATQSVTFTGAFNVTCATYTAEMFMSLIFPAGQTFTVTSSILLGRDASSANLNNSTTIKSATPGSMMGLAYTGPSSGNKVFMVTFTDVDASLSSQPVINYFGQNPNGGLTNTKNIFNINPPLAASSIGATSAI